MAYLDISSIRDWHAHVYFDVASRDAARELREAMTARFDDTVRMGRFHERPVGPHASQHRDQLRDHRAAPSGWADLTLWICTRLAPAGHPRRWAMLGAHRLV